MTAIAAREKLATVLLGPHLSEKSSRAAEQNKQFVFRVRTDADKLQIRKAVEQMTGKPVKAVNVVIQSVRMPPAAPPTTPEEATL